MPMPEFMVGYVIGFGSVVITMILSAVLFPRKIDEKSKDDEEGQ